MAQRQYNYQCDTNGQIIARVASDQIIVASDSFTKTEHLDVVGCIYDNDTKDIYIPMRDSENELVLSGGKPQRDPAKLDVVISIE